jgi:hypothetical protein
MATLQFANAAVAVNSTSSAEANDYDVRGSPEGEAAHPQVQPINPAAATLRVIMSSEASGSPQVAGTPLPHSSLSWGSKRLWKHAKAIAGIVLALISCIAAFLALRSNDVSPLQWANALAYQRECRERKVRLSLPDSIGNSTTDRVPEIRVVHL